MKATKGFFWRITDWLFRIPDDSLPEKVRVLIEVIPCQITQVEIEQIDRANTIAFAGLNDDSFQLQFTDDAPIGIELSGFRMLVDVHPQNTFFFRGKSIEVGNLTKPQLVFTATLPCDHTRPADCLPHDDPKGGCQGNTRVRFIAIPKDSKPQDIYPLLGCKQYETADGENWYRKP